MPGWEGLTSSACGTRLIVGRLFRAHPWVYVRIEIHRTEPDTYQRCGWGYPTPADHLHELRFRKDHVVRGDPVGPQPHLIGMRIEGDVQRRRTGAGNAPGVVEGREELKDLVAHGAHDVGGAAARTSIMPDETSASRPPRGPLGQGPQHEGQAGIRRRGCIRQSRWDEVSICPVEFIDAPRNHVFEELRPGFYREHAGLWERAPRVLANDHELLDGNPLSASDPAQGAKGTEDGIVRTGSDPAGFRRVAQHAFDTAAKPFTCIGFLDQSAHGRLRDESGLDI